MKKILNSLLISYLIALNNLINAQITPPEVYVHWFQPLDNSKRLTSLPYISGDTFRAIANVIIDELRIPIEPSTIKDGDIIFLKTEYLNFFFTTIHPQITQNYILITHNSDFSAPGKYKYMLDDPKLIAWFAVNKDIEFHPKLFPIPIGIANRYCPTIGNVSVIESIQNRLISVNKEFLLIENFLTHTNLERVFLEKLFSKKHFCHKSDNKPWPQYLFEMAQSKFVLCPHGNGLDCHRTWEALLMGCFPIVRTSSLDSLYDDLPVLIVNDWHDITEELLIQKYIEMKNKTYNNEKFYAAFWLTLIQKHRKKYLNKC